MTLRNEDECRKLTAEMGWLRKLAGVSRRQWKKNKDIRLDLSKMETLVQTYGHRLQWFGHVEQMDNSRLPAKSLATLLSGTRRRSQGKVKIGRQCQRGSNVPHVVERVKDRKRWRKFVHVAPSSATYG